MLQYHISKLIYTGLRVFFRIILGRKKRDKLFFDKHIRPTSFFLKDDMIVSKNGIKACIRRSTQDFEILFVRKEHFLSHLILKNDEVFVDVGSNVGTYTLMMASKYPKNKIISIEAHPKTFEVLSKNVNEVNGFQNVILVNKGVFNKTGQIKLYEQGSWTGNPSIFRKSNSSVIIPIDTLDNILEKYQIKKVGIIKIDVEGAEIEVLEGAEEILKKCRKIIVETHDNSMLKVKTILEDRGFETEILKNGVWVVGSRN